MAADLDRRVRERAQDACEYCGLPQSAYRFRFSIDHIIATQHSGPTAAGNLCLACPRCNASKGPNVAGVDPLKGRIARLFHPRRHKWSAHFAWDGPVLRGKTAIGRTTIHVLAINDPSAVAVRQALIAEGVFHPRRGKPTIKTTKPVLDGRAWLGKADAYGTTFILELFESRQHPGYYHYAMHCTNDSFCIESKRPVRAAETDGIGFWTVVKSHLSMEHGLILDDLVWLEVKPEELPLSAEKARAGK